MLFKTTLKSLVRAMIVEAVSTKVRYEPVIDMKPLKVVNDTKRQHLASPVYTNNSDNPFSHAHKIEQFLPLKANFVSVRATLLTELSGNFDDESSVSSTKEDERKRKSPRFDSDEYRQMKKDASRVQSKRLKRPNYIDYDALRKTFTAFGIPNQDIEALLYETKLLMSNNADEWAELDSELLNVLELNWNVYWETIQMIHVPKQVTLARELPEDELDNPSVTRYRDKYKTAPQGAPFDNYAFAQDRSSYTFIPFEADNRIEKKTLNQLISWFESESEVDADVRKTLETIVANSYYSDIFVNPREGSVYTAFRATESELQALLTTDSRVVTDDDLPDAGKKLGSFKYAPRSGDSCSSWSYAQTLNPAQGDGDYEVYLKASTSDGRFLAFTRAFYLLVQFKGKDADDYDKTLLALSPVSVSSVRWRRVSQ